MLRYSSKGNMSSLPYILFLTKFCSLFSVSLSSFSYFLFLHFSYPFIGHCFLYFIFPYSSKCFLPPFSLPFFPFCFHCWSFTIPSFLGLPPPTISFFHHFSLFIFPGFIPSFSIPPIYSRPSLHSIKFQ